MHSLMKEKNYLTQKVKPQLQQIIAAIEVEEKGKKKDHAIGECVEYFIKEKMLSEILGLALSNRPTGVLFVAIKLTTFLIKVVNSTDILHHADAHGALYQLLTFIYNSLENDMLTLQAEERKILIEFLKTLTFKIT